MKIKSSDDLVIGKGIWTVEKFINPGMPAAEFDYLVESGKIIKPDEVLKSHNIWLTVGWTKLLDLISGQATDHFDAANAVIGVGIDSTAAAVGQTDLIGATTKYKNMLSGYPTAASSGTIEYKARFLSSEGNFAWNEMVLRNGSGVCWNRNATGWGTKDSTGVWTASLTLGKA